MKRSFLLKNSVLAGFVTCMAGMPTLAQQTEQDGNLQHLALQERIWLNEEGGPSCTLTIDMAFFAEEANERFSMNVKTFYPETVHLSPDRTPSASNRIEKGASVKMTAAEQTNKVKKVHHNFSALNQAILQAAFDINDNISFLMAAARYRDTLQENYRREAGAMRSAFPDAASLDYEYLFNGKVIDTGRIYQTYRLEHTAYTGGAHPLTTVRYFNFLNGKEIKVADAFGENAGKKLEKLLLECLMEKEGVKTRAQLEALSYFPDQFFVSENFYCTEEACVFVYNPYEIAPYSRGCVEISIPYAKLRKAGLR